MSKSSGKPLLVVIRRSKLSAGDEGRRICTEFKQAKYPFKWRRYMCARCGVLRDEHNACKSKLSAGEGGEHDTSKSKLSAGDKGEHGADKCKLSTEDEGERSTNKSKVSAGEEGERVCTEFKQAKYPFKWKKYMCVRCGVLRSEHRQQGQGQIGRHGEYQGGSPATTQEAHSQVQTVTGPCHCCCCRIQGEGEQGGARGRGDDLEPGRDDHQGEESPKEKALGYTVN
ncbi:hypothetical protein ZWY2020_051616 [Hordeum vulgare]|nr:hypothetical protein ZWY2020_051616 [Hordeum vulgare]